MANRIRTKTVVDGHEAAGWSGGFPFLLVALQQGGDPAQQAPGGQEGKGFQEKAPEFKGQFGNEQCKEQHRQFGQQEFFETN